MNSIERVNRVLRGKKSDRTPVCLINFQPACTWAGYSLRECFTDGEKLAHSQILAWEKLGHDVVHIQNGVVGMSQLLGCEIGWKDDASPWVVARPSDEIEHYVESNLRPDSYQPGSLVGELVKAVKIISSEIGGKVVVRPEGDLGPFSLAAQLVGIQGFMMQLADPERRPVLHRFISYCAELVLDLCIELHQAGAALIGSGEGTAGPEMISPRDYRRFAKPYHCRLTSELASRELPTILHICGNATAILEDMVETGAAALELDERTARKSAAEACRGRTAVFGNLSPQFVASATEQQVFEQSCKCVQEFGRSTRLVLGPGCDLPVNTPLENARAIVEAARAHGNSTA